MQARDPRWFVRDLLQQPVLRRATSGAGYGATARTGAACQTSEVGEIGEVGEVSEIAAITATCAIAAALSALHRAPSSRSFPGRSVARSTCGAVRCRAGAPVARV